MDTYYFPNGLPGTAFATMELIEPDGLGPLRNRVGTFELVTFTKRSLPPARRTSGAAPFDEADPCLKMARRMYSVMTAVGHYSYEAVLDPGETAEVPGGEGEPTRCLILDEYRRGDDGFVIEGKHHCLLLCMEVFRSEMDHARRHGSATVLARLKERGFYPYSDLDREPVF